VVAALPYSPGTEGAKMTRHHLRLVRAMAVGVTLVTLTLLSQAAAWAAPGPSSTPTPTVTVTVTPTPAPLVNAPGADSYWFIGVIVVGVAFLGVGAVAANAWGAYQWRKTLTNTIASNIEAGIDKGTYSATDTEKLLRLVQEPHGVRGVTRGLIALLILVLASLALAVTIISAAPDASDLRKTIVTSLLSVLATIVGFYFGSRTAQTAASDAAHGSTTTPAPTTPPDGKADEGNAAATDTTTSVDTKTDKESTTTPATTAPTAPTALPGKGAGEEGGDAEANDKGDQN
jgi:hypothetical protein